MDEVEDTRIYEMVAFPETREIESSSNLRIRAGEIQMDFGTTHLKAEFDTAGGLIGNVQLHVV
jgi:hypothetical protein